MKKYRFIYLLTDAPQDVDAFIASLGGASDNGVSSDAMALMSYVESNPEALSNPEIAKLFEGAKVDNNQITNTQPASKKPDEDPDGGDKNKSSDEEPEGSNKSGSLFFGKLGSRGFFRNSMKLQERKSNGFLMRNKNTR